MIWRLWNFDSNRPGRGLVLRRKKRWRGSWERRDSVKIRRPFCFLRSQDGLHVPGSLLLSKSVSHVVRPDQSVNISRFHPGVVSPYVEGGRRGCLVEVGEVVGEGFGKEVWDGHRRTPHVIHINFASRRRLCNVIPCRILGIGITGPQHGCQVLYDKKK